MSYFTGQRYSVHDKVTVSSPDVCFPFCAKYDKYPVISKIRHIKMTHLHRKQVLNTSDGKMVQGVEVKLEENKQSLQTL